jgi:hypothetical protein
MPGTIASTQADSITSAQSAGLNQYSFGEVSVGSNYDTLFGVTYNTHYAHQLNDNFAIGAIGEYGPNQYRLNGTLANSLWTDGQFKFSYEYLNQNLPFDFDSGDINQRVHQSAYGVELQQALHQNFFQDINLGGYRSEAPNVSLSEVTFNSDGLYYTNQRHIAGAVSQGADIGTHMKLTSRTGLGAKLFYDDVHYNTAFTEDSSENSAGIGGSLSLEQILSDRLKLSIKSDVREIYDTYRTEIAYAPAFGQSLGLRLSLFGQRLVSSNTTPNSNSYGLEVSVLSDDNTTSPNYTLANPTATPNLAEWAKTPAVYMDRVLAMAEQKTTLVSNSPTLTTISPSTGSSGQTVTLSGAHLSDTLSVAFGGVPATSFANVSDTSVTAVTPAHAAGSVDVVLTTNEGSSVLASGYEYTGSLPPTLNLVNPNNKSFKFAQTPTSLTFTGTSLTGASSGSVNCTPAAAVQLQDVQAQTDTTATAMLSSSEALPGITTCQISLSTTAGTTNTVPFTYNNS